MVEAEECVRRVPTSLDEEDVDGDQAMGLAQADAAAALAPLGQLLEQSAGQQSVAHGGIRRADGRAGRRGLTVRRASRRGAKCFA